ncbi:MAG TPA: hypothetical protein VGE07_01895, partial [Herpetosiphonaceae bacterium]
PPAVPGVMPLSGPVAAPRRKRPLWIDIPGALIVLFIGAWLIASGLRAQREGSAARLAAGNPAASAKPAAPAESAEQRATQFLNGLYGGMNDPRFYDSKKNIELLEPLADKYFAPGVSRTGLLIGLRLGLSSADMPEEEIEAFTSMIDEVHLKGAKYKATNRTDTSVTLELVGGDLEILATDGERYSTPILESGMEDMQFEMKLMDGTWYIEMMACGCDTAK